MSTSVSTQKNSSSSIPASPTEKQKGTLEKMKNGVFGFAPNSYQLKFYETLIGTKNNIGINAKAGTGKTTTIIDAIRLLSGEKVLFLAFNKSIATELQEKFASLNFNNVEVNTVHSQGYKVLRNAITNQGKKVRVDSSLFTNYVRSCFQTEYFDEGRKRYNYSELSDLHAEIKDFDPLDYVRNSVKLANLGRMFLTSQVEGLEEIAERYCIELILNQSQKIASILKAYTNRFFSALTEGSINSTLYVDFTDMLWLPNVALATSIGKEWRIEKYDYVFIDEAQDLSKAQRILVQKFVKSTGRLIFVGDPNQSIYGFAGADNDSFNALTQIPNTINLDLNLCYRCGSKIIEEARDRKSVV